MEDSRAYPAAAAPAAVACACQAFHPGNAQGQVSVSVSCACQAFHPGNAHGQAADA
jgi:hypothetical protein